ALWYYPASKEADGPPKRFVFTFRSVVYALAFLFIFCFSEHTKIPPLHVYLEELTKMFPTAVAELGLVSYYLHKYGNTYEHYPSKEFKHVLGLLLCAVLISLIVSLTHFWLRVGLVAFTSFILAIFFATGAGVIQRTTPFKGTNCGHATERHWPDQWQPYAGECKNIVTMQGLGWGLGMLQLSCISQCSSDLSSTCFQSVQDRPLEDFTPFNSLGRPCSGLPAAFAALLSNRYCVLFS
ncbi:hypothetical protein CVT24_010369, partial [Panaeolus cyanescens]